MNEKALSLQVIAQRLNVSDETARKEIESGRLKAFRIGRQWRIFEGDFQEYLNHRSSQQAA